MLFGSALIDLLVVSLPAAALFAAMQAFGITVPQLLSGLSGIVAMLYVFLAHRGQVPSASQWAFGLIRLSCDEIQGYSGRGVVYAVSSSRNALRVVIVGLCIVAMGGLLYLIAPELWIRSSSP